MRKDTIKKCYIVRVKGNDEIILSTYESEDRARDEFIKFKQKNKKRKGVYQLIYASMQSDGELDRFNRQSLDYFCPQVEEFLRNVLE